MLNRERGRGVASLWSLALLAVAVVMSSTGCSTGTQAAPAATGAGQAVSPVDPGVSDEVTRAVPTRTPDPQCTEEARESGAHGLVIVQAVVTKEGALREVKILKDEVGMGMGQVTAESVGRSKFKPGMHEGKPVDTYYHLTVNFDCRPR